MCQLSWVNVKIDAKIDARIIIKKMYVQFGKWDDLIEL